MNYKNRIQEFDIRDIELPLLASETAIDIDNYIGGRSQENKSVLYLSKLLEDATQGENPEAKFPDNCLVLGYSISGREKFNEYWKGKNIDEMVLQIKLISKDLEDFKNLSMTQQKDLMNFCVRLSKEVSYHRDEYYSNKSRLVV